MKIVALKIIVIPGSDRISVLQLNADENTTMPTTRK